ncbi:unnamed protein product [Gongylonema pulchrum]|uniref:Uncharacterized protein n=1 Tax=Gongylonema pulchrum TaxID=637853 RepID=A0A3P7M0A7_9BILA|nr:unnamed protein product [Gongylonema pulchrum]
MNIRGHMLIQPNTHDTVLHAAISSQEPAIVEMILKAFTHLVTTKNADGSTALHWASQCGNLAIVKLLLEFSYDEDVLTKIEDVSGRFTYHFVLDVNALDAQCRTALYLAVANSHYDVVKYLLEVELPSMNTARKCPFQVDVYCSGGKTPLMVAAANGNIPLVKLLLEHGADVNLPCGLTDADISSLDGARCVGSGALNEACRIGCVPLVQLLLQRGAVDHENVALATAFKYNQEALVRIFLLRLTFVDPDYRINKKGMDFGQMSINRHLLPSTVYPTSPCMLNWHNASLASISNDWLIAACLQVNQRLRTSRMALAALTRIDLSKNKMKVLSGQLLQLSSLRSLNAANNEIMEIEIPNDGIQAPLLESLSLEYNELSFLPDDFFTSRMPVLCFLDVSHNKLSTLPDTLWLAPRLRELNLSNNKLSVLPAIGSSQLRPSSSLSGSDQPGSNHSETRTYHSTVSTDDSISIGGRIDDSNITVHELKRHNVWQRSVRLAQSDESDSENGSVTSASTLTSLNISNNNIKVAPSCLACCCPRLTRLNISHNQLTSLGPVECMPSRLRHLDASSNQLISAFERPVAVQLVCHAVSAQQSAILQMRHPSPTRNPRSRSKSAVRSQRSLSVARIGDTLHDTHIDACPHKQHIRLESLRSLYLANNRLTEIPLFAPNAKTTQSPKKKQRESRQKSSASWSKRMGHSTGGADRTAKGANMSTVGVDIAEWTFEPKKTKGEPTFGPITFRTWDFGGQREYYATHQYFLSRRSLYVLVWKTTDGEAALPDIHQWLVNIQGFYERMKGKKRFVMVPDADKKGLPRVVESVYVSSKTKQNIRALCNLLYRTAYDIRSVGSKERLLDQKIPASYLALEKRSSDLIIFFKIVVELGDERRSAGIEPVMTNLAFRSAVQERMLKNYGRAFRDDIEFNHACSFLHENGWLPDSSIFNVTLRELYFLDPQWLCDILAHVITIREINPFARNGLMKIDDLQMLFKSLKLGSSAINLRSHIISLLQKFEVALTWQSRSLLIPSLLPDEYQLRGGYPGSRVMVPTRAASWQLEMMERDTTNTPKQTRKRAPHLHLQSFFCQRSLGDLRHPATIPQIAGTNMRKKPSAAVSVDRSRHGNDMGIPEAVEQKITVNVQFVEQELVRRVYMMAYIPSGFWSRLMTRMLVDDHITACVERLLQVEHLPDGCTLDILKELCNKQFHPQWLLWQTGFEVLHSRLRILSYFTNSSSASVLL